MELRTERASATAALAAFASGLEYADLPAEVAAHAKLLMLDTIGCALYGATTPWGRIVCDFVKECGRGEGAVLWAEGTEVPPPNAPLANGTFAHSFELDDHHMAGALHPGAVTLPAAHAVLRLGGAVSGKDFLAAYVAGYEAGIRAGLGCGPALLSRGFHSSGILGTFCAAAAAARILRLDPGRTRHALGIAGTQGAGLMAAQHGAMVKRMHVGRAAQSGVYGALLAAKGFTGIEDVIEAPYGGLFSAFVGAAETGRVTEGLGETYETLNVGFKVYPCCAGNHTALDAYRRIRERAGGIDPEAIETITVRATRATLDHVCWPYRPESVTAAQMNLPYCLAALAVDGIFFVDQVAEAAIARPDLLRMVERIEAVEEPAFEALGPKGRYATLVEVALRDGTHFEEKVVQARGRKETPVPEEEVREKYRLLASKVFAPARVERLLETVLAFEKEEDARVLDALLVPG